MIGNNKSRGILWIVLAAVLMLAGFRVVAGLFCDRACEARHAAEQYVEALADSDYETYATLFEDARHESARIEEFESRKACLDWGRAKLGEVYDFPESPDFKVVVLHAPSGDFVVETKVRLSESTQMGGKEFVAYGYPGECPSKASVVLQAWGYAE